MNTRLAGNNMAITHAHRAHTAPKFKMYAIDWTFLYIKIEISVWFSVYHRYLVLC